MGNECSDICPDWKTKIADFGRAQAFQTKSRTPMPGFRKIGIGSDECEENLSGLEQFPGIYLADQLFQPLFHCID